MKQAALGRLLRGTLRNGQVRVLMCDTTNMAELCRMTHEPSNVCAAALGLLWTMPRLEPVTIAVFFIPV